MHQTISGVTHKVRIEDRKIIDSFLEENKSNFTNIKNSSICMYEENVLIDNPAINYLNEHSERKTFNILKSLIGYEYNECERLYPNLGEVFVENFHDQKKINLKSFRFTRKNVNSFINSLNNEISQKIAKIIFEKCSLDYLISLNYTKENRVVIEKNESLIFNLSYDASYLGRKNSHVMIDYNFIIIDGVIESLGEIHHLLHEASINKEPYVIFCFGTSEEVKRTIIENNKRGITEIFPICFDVNEESLNILNDIAVLHNEEIVSALKGQTISQEVRKKLSKGKKISIQKNNFSFDICCSDAELKSHQMFLNKRINETKNEQNKNYLIKRHKQLFSKKINIYIPDFLKKQIHLIREIDYVFRFFMNIQKSMVKIKFNKENKRIYYIPADYFVFVNNKVTNLKKIFEKLEKIITITGD